MWTLAILLPEEFLRVLRVLIPGVAVVLARVFVHTVVHHVNVATSLDLVRLTAL